MMLFSLENNNFQYGHLLLLKDILEGMKTSKTYDEPLVEQIHSYLDSVEETIQTTNMCHSDTMLSLKLSLKRLKVLSGEKN